MSKTEMLKSLATTILTNHPLWGDREGVTLFKRKEIAQILRGIAASYPGGSTIPVVVMNMQHVDKYHDTLPKEKYIRLVTTESEFEWTIAEQLVSLKTDPERYCVYWSDDDEGDYPIHTFDVVEYKKGKWCVWLGYDPMVQMDDFPELAR